MSNFEPNAIIRGFQLTVVGSKWKPSLSFSCVNPFSVGLVVPRNFRRLNQRGPVHAIVSLVQC